MPAPRSPRSGRSPSLTRPGTGEPSKKPRPGSNAPGAPRESRKHRRKWKPGGRSLNVQESRRRDMKLLGVLMVAVLIAGIPFGARAADLTVTVKNDTNFRQGRQPGQNNRVQPPNGSRRPVTPIVV